MHPIPTRYQKRIRGQFQTCPGIYYDYYSLAVNMLSTSLSLPPSLPVYERFVFSLSCSITRILDLICREIIRLLFRVLDGSKSIIVTRVSPDFWDRREVQGWREKPTITVYTFENRTLSAQLRTLTNMMVLWSYYSANRFFPCFSNIIWQKWMSPLVMLFQLISDILLRSFS